MTEATTTIDLETLNSFRDRFNVRIRLTPQQDMALRSGERTSLTIGQLRTMLEDMILDTGNRVEFTRQYAGSILPLSVTVFVLNNDTWRLMKKRPEHADRMLPMVTMPWFFWRESAMSKANPHGVVRHDSGEMNFDVTPEGNTVIISGRGGDFCGFVEGRVAEGKFRGRPVITPGEIGHRGIVPKYDSALIELKVGTGKIGGQMFPRPEQNLDYRFSESPKIFYDHGLQIAGDGSSFLLRVNRRRWAPLRGDVRLLIGRRWREGDPHYVSLLARLWLLAIHDVLVGRMGL